MTIQATSIVASFRPYIVCIKEQLVTICSNYRALGGADPDCVMQRKQLTLNRVVECWSGVDGDKRSVRQRLAVPRVLVLQGISIKKTEGLGDEGESRSS